MGNSVSVFHRVGSRHLVEIALVTFVYIASQLYYKYVLVTPFSRFPIQHFMQYIDVGLLYNDLAQSLFYLHSQPPGMNILLGIIIKIAPEHYVAVLEWFYFFIGLVAVHYLYRTLELLGLRLILRFVVISWLCVFPTYYLYATWPYATHLEFALCCVLAYGMARFVTDDAVTFNTALYVFIPCGLLAMVRPQWHLAIFLVLAVSMVAFRRENILIFAKAFCIAMLPLVLLYSKNFIIFGFFGASSWMGVNMAAVSNVIVSKSQLESLREAGEVSPSFMGGFGKTKAKEVRRRWEKKHTPAANHSHPVLKPLKSDGWTNYNYIAYVENGKQGISDSLAIIKHYPEAFVRVVADRMLAISLKPSLAYKCCGFSVSNIRAFKKQYKALPAQWQRWMSTSSFVFYVVTPLIAFMLACKQQGQMRRYRALIIPGVMLAGMMFVTSCALTGGEQERMRWALVPFYTIFAAMLAEVAARRCERISTGYPVKFFERLQGRR